MNQATLIVLIIFAAVVTISVIIQTCVLAGLFIASRKMQRKAQALMEDVRIHALPLLNTSRGMAEDLTPKIKTMASNLAETTSHLRGISEDVSGVVGDVAGRARAQAQHVDGMVQGTLDSISQAGDTIQRGLALPVRQLNGIVNGLRAGWNVICQKTPPRYGRGTEGDRFSPIAPGFGKR